MVPDGEPVTEALRQAVADGVAVVLTSGGTGISPTDRTPEATRACSTTRSPGSRRRCGRTERPGCRRRCCPAELAGVAGRTLIINLPGSTGGARDGLAVLRPLLPHAVDQVHGGDHR